MSTAWIWEVWCLYCGKRVLREDATVVPGKGYICDSCQEQKRKKKEGEKK